MSKEIIINAEKGHTRIAILEDGDLCELYIENPENTRTIGDLHVGRIRRIMPTIQAAFVDIGQKSDAFLHFSDLSDNLDEWLELVGSKTPTVAAYLASKTGNVRATKIKGEDGDDDFELDEDDEATDRGSNSRRSTSNANADDETHPKEYLKRDHPILVKIVKEPISNKGSRISTDISLAGRFLVLVPLADYVAVSKKISSYKERRRLRTLAKSLLPKGFGVIVRTVAQGKDARSLDTDLRLLIDKWRKIESAMQNGQKPPKLVHQDVNMASSVIRDLFSSDYDRILIDDVRTFRNIKGYIQAVAPQMADVVDHYEGEHHIFQATHIAGKVKEAFESRVNLPSGGYLFIEHTEAMHVVDVNSGRSVRGDKQEENSLRVNLEAARAIAKQIRLRDLGGIIVIDFIDQRHERNAKKIYDEMRKEFKKDRAVSKILPMTDFGLMQITRQRIRPSVTTQIDADALPEPLPEEIELAKAKAQAAMAKAEPQREDRSRGGDRRRGSSTTPEELLAELNAWVEAYRKRSKGRKPVKLRLHPFTATYLRARMPSQSTRWFMKHLIRVRLETEDSMHPMDYAFIDTEGKDITRPPAEKPAAKQNESEKEEASTTSSKGGSSRSSSGRSSNRSSSSDRSSSRRSSSNRSSSNSKSSSNRGRSSSDGQGKSSSNTRGQAPATPEEQQDENSNASSSSNSNRRRRGSRGGRNRRRGGRGRSENTAADANGSNETPANAKAAAPANENRNPQAEEANGDDTASSSSRRRSRRRGGRRRGGRNRNTEANETPSTEQAASQPEADRPAPSAEPSPAQPDASASSAEDPKPKTSRRSRPKAPSAQSTPEADTPKATAEKPDNTDETPQAADTESKPKATRSRAQSRSRSRSRSRQSSSDDSPPTETAQAAPAETPSEKPAKASTPAPKADAPKADAPKPELKAEAATSDAPKAKPKPKTSKATTATSEAPKPESADTSTDESKKKAPPRMRTRSRSRSRRPSSSSPDASSENGADTDT
ncbi:MAG: hypothetical protein RhofKO_22190 [Rhodothermales bacterium]